ncbi:hypothetical protein V0288_20955 [Pannus brasiliensis CCIBt3594]|uniref:Peptidase M15A C-terminal domain-containing protein n=1 Tax=Pannus brasiliensis CCIBt3594 TaxID=1427578 RepID=A0AAW9QRV7_9CHRO
MKRNDPIGKYFTLEEFCTCSNTYRKNADRIDPYPKNPDSIEALRDLARYLLDPIVEYFGKERFTLTYGFCSVDLKRFLARKDPETGLKNGRVDPSRDQHLANEIDAKGRYYCSRLGASCDFHIKDLSSDALVDWILDRDLPFDSLYYYGRERSIHLSHGPQQKRDIWTFTPAGTPTRKGIEKWRERTRSH